MPARLLLSLVAGLMLWLAFPAHGLWPLAFAGAGVLTLALAGCGPARGGLLGLVAGLACFVPLLSWSGIYVGATPWLALATLESLYVAAFGALLGQLQRSGTVRPVAAGLAWVVTEFARATTPFGGFPWGRLAYSQADSPVLGLVSLLGTPGVAFAVVLAGALVARALQSLLGGAGSDRRARLLAVPAVGVAAAVVLAPALVPRPVDGEPLQVMGVQGNVPEMTLEFNAQRRAVLDNHATATEAAAEQVAAGQRPAPDVVLWPENSSDIDPLTNDDAARVIEQAVAAVDVPLVVGAVLEGPGENVSNTSLLYVPGEGVVDAYTKRRPAPFAEYIPYRGFFRMFSDKVDLVARDFVAGQEVGVLQVPLADGPLPLGVAICFEVVFDDVMRDSVRAGAEVMFVPTNNATFGFTDESVQQLAASRVKAVELGRSVAHVSTVGVSGLITPDGRVHEGTDLFSRAVMSAELPRRTELSWAVRLGPWPERVAVGALGVLLVLSGRSQRAARGPGGTPVAS
ncbi:apolipoprotein N-acyltransferase [Ornithinicoccus halotolerans]|uniref:apolipoprotein N-acyltransferase n=1 Tax=Ornithinicoccus halotolerans TaxID=1748220 RepID=UPI001E2A2455|nr:apolipoprotein N-acyltransferase [Ornithinicoccus halotolerans]